MLGEIPKNDADRDAVHVAIVPIVTGEDLKPGTPVRVQNGIAYRSHINPIGIIDPFLSHTAYKGYRVYLCLYPNSVIGMRHHWQCPQFDFCVEQKEYTQDKKEAKEWIEGFCDRWSLDYSSLISEATSSNDYRYVVADGQDLHSREELGDEYYEFWKQLEILTGQTFTEKHKKGLGWSCSC